MAERQMGDLQREVDAAQAALLRVLDRDKREWWDPADLRNKAQNGWSGDVMMYALTDLVNRGKLELGGKLAVRLAPSDRASV